MVLHKITPPVDYKQWLKRLDTQLKEATNRKVSNVLKATNKKTLEKK